MTEATKKVAENWHKLTKDQKKKYEQMVEEDKARYQRQMNQLMTEGYFITDEGIKSTDMKVKKKRAATKPI